MKITLRICNFVLAATAMVAWAAVSLAAESKNTLQVRFEEQEPNEPLPVAFKPDTPAALQPESNAAPSAKPAPMVGEDWDDNIPFDDECGLEGGCRSCCWFDNLPWSNGKGTLYFGADYLLVKPRFSQAVARVDRTLVVDQTVTPQTSTVTETSAEYAYDYRSSFRVFAGLHSSRCGGDIQFTYWHLVGDGSSGPGPAANITAGTTSAGQLGNTTIVDGDRLSAASSISANLYDLDFTRCLSLGGSVEPCDPCACPRWDVRWLAGVRIVDLNHQDSNVITNATDVERTFGNIDADFTGAGPRVGMQGRRYFGDCARFSLFAKGSAALLLGEYNVRRTLTTPSTTPNDTTFTTVQNDSLNRMMPMAEIEVGASYQFGERLFFTGGWMFQAWFDAASSQTINATSFGALDTGNVLGFDGLFLRGEYMF